MINLKKSFGSAAAAFLQSLPSIVNCIGELNAAGVHIVIVDGYVGSWDPRTKFLRIGKKCSWSIIATTLLHENHHRKHPSLVPNLEKTRRSQWVQRQIDIEISAIIAEFPAIEEMRSLGRRLSQKEVAWYELYHEGGRRQMRKLMKTTVTSNTLEEYPKYYGDMFDDLVSDHMKRCVKGSTCSNANTKSCKRGVDHFANIEKRMAYMRRRDREAMLDEGE